MHSSSTKQQDSWWAKVNHTELYQLATRDGLPVDPGFSNEALAQLIEEGSPAEHEHSLNLWRDAIMRFVNDFWPKLSSQIRCPAKSRDPHACYGCVDAQVVFCLVKHQAIETHIKERRKAR